MVGHCYWRLVNICPDMVCADSFLYHVYVVKLQNYYFPWELEQELSRFVDYYNNHRYHESLNNVTPADVYFGQNREILTKRDQIKRKTLALRRKQNLNTRVA